jgi:hypothetical protein
VSKEIEVKIYAALGISRDSVKSIEAHEEPALQAVGAGEAAQGRAA